MYTYKIADVIDSLQKSNPKDYRLKKLQGDFYYDISIIYDKDWIINKQEVTRRMYEGYTTAEDHGIELIIYINILITKMMQDKWLDQYLVN